MTKEERQNVIKRILSIGINSKYNRVRSNGNCELREELIQTIILEPSILDEFENINDHIITSILYNYRKELCSYLKKNIRKIESSKDNNKGDLKWD